MYMLQAVVGLMFFCYDTTTSLAKHATKEGKATGNDNTNVALHSDMTNATTSDKEGTAKTVKEGCEDTTSTTSCVPERVRQN